jgi:hypothetical protein
LRRKLVRGCVAEIVAHRLTKRAVILDCFDQEKPPL